MLFSRRFEDSHHLAHCPITLSEGATPDISTRPMHLCFRCYDMIRSFGDRDTELGYHQRFSKRLPHDIQRRALNKLLLLDSAENGNDLRVPPADHFEQMHGNLDGFHSIRINGNGVSVSVSRLATRTTSRSRTIIRRTGDEYD